MSQFTLYEVLSQQMWRIEVACRVVDCGPHPEHQNARNEGFCFTVVAEHKVTGHRWSHVTSFSFIPACINCYWSTPAEDSESSAAHCSRCGHGEPSRASAEARAKVLEARINHAIALGVFKGPDGNKNWRVTEPACGSQAYQDLRYPKPPDLPRKTYGFAPQP